jgi:hypothetical protein
MLAGGRCPAPEPARFAGVLLRLANPAVFAAGISLRVRRAAIFDAGRADSMTTPSASGFIITDFARQVCGPIIYLLARRPAEKRLP